MCFLFVAQAIIVLNYLIFLWNICGIQFSKFSFYIRNLFAETNFQQAFTHRYRVLLFSLSIYVTEYTEETVPLF
jgi:hypothetical protein